MRRPEREGKKLALSNMCSRTAAIASEKAARGLRYQAAWRTGNVPRRAKRLASKALITGRQHPFTGSVPDYLEQLAGPDRYRPTHCPQCQAKEPLTAHQVI